MRLTAAECQADGLEDALNDVARQITPNTTYGNKVSLRRLQDACGGYAQPGQEHADRPPSACAHAEPVVDCDETEHAQNRESCAAQQR